jgi:hypothetical protein
MNDFRATDTTRRSPSWHRGRRRCLAAVLPLAAVGAYLLLAGGWESGSAQAAIVGSGGGNGVTEQSQLAEAQPTETADKPNGFMIAGSVHGLYPGKVAALALTVTNPLPFAIKVTSITIVVSDANPGCAAANAMVTSFSGSLAVPKLGSAVATVQFTLFHSAPNACQGAVFPLKYSGEATKA